MKVKLTSRNSATGETVETSAKCDTIEDLEAIIKSVVNDAEAWLNDLQIVKRGLVEMFMYNYKEEVLLYLQGSKKELNAKLDRTV